MLLILFVVLMFIGGIYAIFSAKVPSFLVGGGKRRVEGLFARLIGVLLILPLTVAFLGGKILPLLFGEAGAQYAGNLELITLLGSLVLSAVLVRVGGKRVEPLNTIKATIAMSTAETPVKITILQLTLFLVMAATLIMGIWVRLMAAGLYLVFFGLPLFIIAGFHLRFQVSAIHRVSTMKPPYISLILLSNLFFFLGFALQVDNFLGLFESGVQLAIVAFYNHYFMHGARGYIPAGQFYLYMYISIAFLVALIVSWFFLQGELFLKQETSE